MNFNDTEKNIQSSRLKITLELKNEAATQRLGELIAQYLQTPLICYLNGELGVGKTRLIRAIIQSCGHEGNVKSPTYTLVEPYKLADFDIYHFDLYRLSDPEELEYMGIRDYFDHQSIVFIEWPSNGDGWLARADVSISLSFHLQGRQCQLHAETDNGDVLLKKLKQYL